MGPEIRAIFIFPCRHWSSTGFFFLDSPKKPTTPFEILLPNLGLVKQENRRNSPHFFRFQAKQWKRAVAALSPALNLPQAGNEFLTTGQVQEPDR